MDFEEKNKIEAFVNSCNDMINSKPILADVKILKILNMIANSEILSRYIQECLIDYDFNREYSKAQVQNCFNNGQFTIPAEPDKLVAMVFSLLVEFDKKRIDFYSFINTNFATLNHGGQFDNFVSKMLIPFRDTIAKKFGLIKDNVNQNTNDIKQPVDNSQTMTENVINQNEPTEEDKIWKNIKFLVENITNTVAVERHIKGNDKEDIIYIIKSIDYCSKYKDMRLISSFLMAVEMVTKKVRSINIMMEEIKKEIKHYYDYMLEKSQKD